MIDYTLSRRSDRKRLNDFMQIKMNELVRKIEQFKSWPTLEKDLEKSVLVEWKNAKWEPRLKLEQRDARSNSSSHEQVSSDDENPNIVIKKSESSSLSVKSRRSKRASEIGFIPITPRRNRKNLRGESPRFNNNGAQLMPSLFAKPR